MRRSALITRIGAAVTITLLTAACESPSKILVDEGAAFDKSVHATTAQDDLLKAVRQATSRFNSTTQAIKAGYVPDNHCVAVEGLGGMGYHWANPSLIDPVFDPLQPEVMLYAPGPGGNLRLIGVEYIVIATPDQDLEADRPSFGNHPLDIGGVPPLMAAGVPHWSLHVWLYESNPNGMYTPFNPNVTCPASAH
jgi:hypothetical protein